MSEQNEWIDIEKQKPDKVAVDLKLQDGSIIVHCFMQSNGNFFITLCGLSMLIGDQHIKSWRPHRSE